MRIIRASEREPFTAVDGSEIRELAGPPSATAQNQSLAEARVHPGSETTEHFHKVSEEIYVFLAGEGRMRLGEDVDEVRAGEVVVIPPGTRHKLWNQGPGQLVLLCCCSPPYSDEDTILCD